MSRPFVSLRAFVLALLLAAGPAAADEAVEAARRAVLGTWVNDAVEEVKAPGGASAFVLRSVVFTPTTETYRFAAFVDRDRRQPLFTYESIGPYRIRGASATVPGAVEADLSNDRSLMTIHLDAKEVWKALNLAACPLAVGQAVEIGACVAGPPFNTSRCVDQDLIHVDGAGRLRFGDQTVDRCVARPARLDQASFVRQRD